MRWIAPALMAVGLLVAGTVVLRSGSDESGRWVVAQFESVNGLIEGAPVRSGGLEVGHVEAVRLNEEEVPEVTLRLDGGYVVHDGATADLGMLSQAGQLNRYVELSSGGGRPLGNGATIGLEQTDQPVELDDALGTLTPEVRADVRRIVAGVDRGLAGRGGDISATLQHSDRALRETSDLMADLAADGPALRRLVRASQTLVTELAQDPDDLQGTANELAGTLAVTAARQEELAATVDGLAPGLRGVRRSLDEFGAAIPDLRRLSRNAQPAAREIKLTAPTLVRLLQVAPAGLGSVEQLAREAPPRLTATRPLLRDLKPLLVRLPGVLRDFGPVLDAFRARAPDAFGFITLLNDAAANFDVNGHGVRLATIFGSPPAGEASPADNREGKLPVPFDRLPGAGANDPWTDYRTSFIGDRPWDWRAAAKRQANERKGGTP
ncbi:MlaD family protein [Svornostia abyssi]|uniref:MlaD family protein n=1 Tax=Svornostia abyssi TaxID=2898438 RepID=A0ABY5PIT2_9ACTN|nr:MlaD family protein [Parviterribacteraceae bacterium J379]